MSSNYEITACGKSDLIVAAKIICIAFARKYM
jgi:hypothetical protein